MSTSIHEAVAKRIARLFRMFGSPFEGEAHNALRVMKNLLEAEGLTFNDVAVLIENASGEIRQLKYSDDDAQTIFERGLEKGLAEAERRRELPPEFYNVDGTPRWYEIAEFCLKNSTQQKKWPAITQRMGTTIYQRHAQQHHPFQQAHTQTIPFSDRDFCQIRRAI